VLPGRRSRLHAPGSAARILRGQYSKPLAHTKEAFKPTTLPRSLCVCSPQSNLAAFRKGLFACAVILALYNLIAGRSARN